MKRYTLGLITLMTLSLAACLRAEEATPVVVDLRADALYARANRLPIILFFHSRNCPFCREVDEQYLKPLEGQNAKAPIFLIRRVEIEQTQPLITFSGHRTDFRSFAQQQGVRLVPHLRFVGPDGEGLAPDLVGLSTRDFYGGYLDEAVARARKMLRTSTPSR